MDLKNGVTKQMHMINPGSTDSVRPSTPFAEHRQGHLNKLPLILSQPNRRIFHDMALVRNPPRIDPQKRFTALIMSSINGRS